MNDRSEALVVVKTFDNSTLAEIAKSILDSAGIFAVLHGEYMSTIYTPIAFPIRLMVKAEDADDAIALLEER